MNNLLVRYNQCKTKIQEHQDNIKLYYHDLSLSLESNKSIITKDAEQLYKKIDAQFDAKAKVEQELKALREKILDSALNT